MKHFLKKCLDKSVAHKPDFMTFTNTTISLSFMMADRKSGPLVWLFYHVAPMQIKSPCPLQKHSSYSYLTHVMFGKRHERRVQRFFDLKFWKQQCRHLLHLFLWTRCCSLLNNLGVWFSQTLR